MMRRRDRLQRRVDGRGVKGQGGGDSNHIGENAARRGGKFGVVHRNLCGAQVPQKQPRNHRGGGGVNGGDAISN